MTDYPIRDVLGFAEVTSIKECFTHSLFLCVLCLCVHVCVSWTTNHPICWRGLVSSIISTELKTGIFRGFEGGLCRCVYLHQIPEYEFRYDYDTWGWKHSLHLFFSGHELLLCKQNKQPHPEKKKKERNFPVPDKLVSSDQHLFLLVLKECKIHVVLCGVATTSCHYRELLVRWKVQLEIRNLIPNSLLTSWEFSRVGYKLLITLEAARRRRCSGFDAGQMPTPVTGYAIR